MKHKTYTLISVKETRQVVGTLKDAIHSAKEMYEALQPAFGISVDDDKGNTVCEILESREPKP